MSENKFAGRGDRLLFDPGLFPRSLAAALVVFALVAASSSAAIVINAGGTLLLSQSGSATNNRISNCSAMTSNRGTFNTRKFSEHELSGAVVTPGVGALTLLSSSAIDLGAGASALAFANSSASTWKRVLSTYNWSGSPITGGGTGQPYFGTHSTGLTSDQRSQISFYSDAGTTFLGSAEFLSGMTGELAPVPEPATWFSAALVAGAIVWSRRHRFAAVGNKPLVRVVSRRRLGGRHSRRTLVSVFSTWENAHSRDRTTHSHCSWVAE